MATMLPDKPRSRASVRAGSLSRSEREVFRMLAQGLNGVEIAHRLVLSPARVTAHVRNGRQRLGARTRAHALRSR
jgi:DNA-binding CsgD family transcriptional regulator